MANFVYKIGGSGTSISLDAQKQNVSAIQSIMTGFGWTLTAIAGALGCFQHESGMNPGIYETSHGGDLSNLPYFPGGMGLAQWTDYPAYTAQYPNPLPWSANREHADWWDGNFQCWLLTKANDSQYTDMGFGQGPRWGWQTSNNYPSIPFEDYIHLSGTTGADIDDATTYWFYDMEWHYHLFGDQYLPQRKESARYWFEYMTGHPVPPGPPGPPGPGPVSDRRKLPLWFYLKPRRY